MHEMRGWHPHLASWICSKSDRLMVADCTLLPSQPLNMSMTCISHLASRRTSNRHVWLGVTDLRKDLFNSAILACFRLTCLRRCLGLFWLIQKIQKIQSHKVSILFKVLRFFSFQWVRPWEPDSEITEMVTNSGTGIVRRHSHLPPMWPRLW